MSWREWFGAPTAPAAASVPTVETPRGTSRVRPEKRELLRARLVEAIAKLERRDDEAAVRKLAELRRSLRILDLEAEVEAVRAGGVVVEPQSASMTLGGA